MAQKNLVNYLIRSGVLKTAAIIEAFKKVDRADFVLLEFKDNPYGDYPLALGWGQTISQPTTVAFMLELLAPQKNEKILDVGSGSGWTTALLAAIVGEQGKVWGIEIVPQLAEFGKNNLKKYNFPQAEIILAEKELGLGKEAPFDKILVSAAAAELPRELAAQLKIGGRLVLPIKNSVWQIDKISENKFKKREFFGFVFVPLKEKDSN